jgi:hypothetical protein
MSGWGTNRQVKRCHTDFADILMFGLRIPVDLRRGICQLLYRIQANQPINQTVPCHATKKCQQGLVVQYLDINLETCNLLQFETNNAFKRRSEVVQ